MFLFLSLLSLSLSLSLPPSILSFLFSSVLFAPGMRPVQSFGIVGVILARLDAVSDSQP